MNPFTANLELIPLFSEHLFRVLVGLSLLAIAAIFILPIHFLTKLAGSIIIIGWLIMTVREHCWHIDHAIIIAMLRSDGGWLVTIKDENNIKAELMPGCLVQPWLTILQFRLQDGRKKSLILLKDNVDQDTFRRVRVRLNNNV